MKRWGARLALLLAGLLIGVLLGEVVARTISPNKSSDLLFNSPDSSPMGLYVQDKETRLRPASNFTASIRSLDYSVSLRTNEIGLRGPPLAEVSQEQWIALGDSFTMSVQVEETDSFEHLIGEKQQSFVWNAGVDGYSTWQATLRMRQVMEHIPVKRAILTFFTGNDFQDNERFLAMSRMKLPGKEGDPIPREAVSPWVSFLLRHSFVYAHYRIWDKQKAVESGRDHSRQNWRDELQIFTSQGQGRLRHLRSQSLSALKTLADAAEGGDIELLVAVAPPAFVIDQTRIESTARLVGLDPQTMKIDAPSQEAVSILSQLNIAHCDLTPALREAEKSAATYFTYDGHWTAHGHRAVADEISRCLEKR